MGNLKSRYRKLQAYADGGAVLAESPVPSPVAMPELAPEPDELDKAELPASAKAWLRKPENNHYLYDENASAKLADMHWKVVDTGLEAYSEPYFAEIERRLSKPEVSADIVSEAVDKVLSEARRSAPKPMVEDEPDHSFQSSRRVYSAPPSRESRSSNGSRYLLNDPRSVVMTPAMKEAASIAGISIEEYSRQVLRLRQEKELGNHGGQP